MNRLETPWRGSRKGQAGWWATTPEPGAGLTNTGATPEEALESKNHSADYRRHLLACLGLDEVAVQTALPSA